MRIGGVDLVYVPGVGFTLAREEEELRLPAEPQEELEATVESEEDEDEDEDGKLRWYTGKVWDEGWRLPGFWHIIRSSSDPERLPRTARKGRTTAWKKTLKTSTENIEKWREAIHDQLLEGGPQTFNALCVTIADVTADMALDAAPDRALWQLVETKTVEFTGVKEEGYHWITYFRLCMEA